MGEAKLRLAEFVAESGKACVITQTKVDLISELKKSDRGTGVTFYASKSRTNSSSSLVRRILDAVSFAPFVFLSLVRSRPKHVYVSTNPPVIVPFTVFLYCLIWRSSYTYHLQDIHPEIVNIVSPINRMLFRLLRGIDNITLRNAKRIITLSDEMAEYVKKVSRTESAISLLDNPGFEVDTDLQSKPKTKDFIFCGNAGRVQQIPILIDAIRGYLDQGGELSFTFAGGGIYSSKIKQLADEYEKVTYHGYVKPSEANQLVAEHRWALLPILDEVTKYAFPSKSSSYLAAGCRILAVSSKHSSVSKWVESKGVGVSVDPSKSALVEAFFSIEKTGQVESLVSGEKVSVKPQTIESFLSELRDIFSAHKQRC
ncbi:glycosyltransferase [uncultured Idiomarina sp.]|uniref:glycosyltransferase n=1 Tax=uncultured Idiomarina sp. TaxID=352961 RepID=UPI0032B157C7